MVAINTMNRIPLSLEEMQHEYLRILKDLDSFCTENHFDYYMGCGTLLGAVRHKGFIPWDNDLDIYIPRPVYLHMIKNYSSREFTFRTIYNDRSHPYVFGRLCSNRVIGSLPIYEFGIDVYILNGAPSLVTEQAKLIENVSTHVDRAQKWLRLRDGLIRRNLWPSHNADFSFSNRSLLKADSFLADYDYYASDYICQYDGWCMIRKKDLYGKPVRLQFEDGWFKAPQKYHELLEMYYGDYMQLPPEDKRVPYHWSEYYWK